MQPLKNMITETFIVESNDELQIAKIAKTKDKRQELAIVYLKLYDMYKGKTVQTQDLMATMNKFLPGHSGKLQTTMADFMSVGLIERISRGNYRIHRATFLTDLDRLAKDNTEIGDFPVDYGRNDMRKKIKELKSNSNFNQYNTYMNIGMMDRYISIQFDGIWFNHIYKIYENPPFSWFIGDTKGKGWSIQNVIDNIENVKNAYIKQLYTI